MLPIKRTISLSYAIAALSIINFARADTIYSGKFDYKQYKSSNYYFSGRSPGEIDEFCKKLPHAGQSDMDECAHRDFEKSSTLLNRKIGAIKREISKNDKKLETNGWPVSLPYFLKSQQGWVQYRDNSCYSEIYGIGEASLRYTEFWNCMTRITKNRLQELSNPNPDD